MSLSDGSSYDEIRHQETTFSNTNGVNQDQYSLRSRDEKQGTSSTFLKIAGGAVILGVAVLVIVLPIYFEVIVPNSQEDDVIVSGPDLPENDRFNCMPEVDKPTKEECEKRGCLWATDSSNNNSPRCYYAGNDGYMLNEALVTTNDGFYAYLTRSKPIAEPYGTEFPTLYVNVTRMSKDTLRIRIHPEEEARYEVPWMHEQPDGVGINEALYEVNTVKSAGGLFGIQVKRKSTGTILFDSSVGKMTFADQFLQISTSLASEYIYGFGEHMHETFKHDMNWKSHGMFSRDEGVGPNKNLYGVHPYHLCMEGDGNAHSILFLNSNAQDVSLQPTPALTYRSVGGMFDFYIFVGPEPEQVTAQYTKTIGRPYMPPLWSLGFQLCRYGYGSLDKLKKVVDRMLATEMPYDIQYTDIDYMDRQLDFTINSTTYNGLEDFARDIKNTHQMRYIIILDPAISGNETEGSYPPFDLGKENEVFISTEDGDIAWGKVWPDLPGIYVNTSWDWNSQTEAYRAFAAFPDYFKEITKEWWLNLTVDFYERLEFDGLWIDMNEPASFVHGSPSGCPESKWDNPLPYFPHILGDGRLYDKTTCMGNKQYHPVTGQMDYHYNLHSLYGWSQSEITLDACRESTGERCMVISRSTFPGSGKYVGHWLGDNTSDWPHLSASIIGMLEFNLFGIPYVGADVCGFFQDTTEELCMRWMQLGAFYPFDRNHNGLGFKDQDPASFGPEFATASKKILEIRYYILPYFYTLFYDAHTTGSTVVRSLMAEFPSDVNTYVVDRQMLLGNALLISPVLDPGVDSVEAYVPDARWFDYYTGAELAHGLRNTTTSFYAPWDHIPLHIRGGSIIPTQTPAQTTAIQQKNPLGVMYALSDSASLSHGHLFWDDGTSIDTIENGVFVHVEFHGNHEYLSSSVAHNNYPDASDMTFDHVTVMGIVSDQVSRVIVDGAVHDHFVFDTNTKMLKITGLSLSLMSPWTIMWDTNLYTDRFDCHPEATVAATEQRCKDRGCWWEEVGIPGIPSCYYPTDYGAYKKDTAPQTTPQGEELFLERWNKPEMFENPVQRLKVEVETHSEYQLRIKISDPNSQRYEVPLPIHGVNSERPIEPLYEVIYQDEPFGFKVVRRSTREVIMDTSVGALIFEDQFIQISSKSASTYMYGLGEAEHPNYKLDFFWTTQAFHAMGESVKQDANLYGHHPYHMTMEKTGDAHGILLLNSNPMEISLSPLPAVTYRTIGGILDFYVFLGPTPEQVVQQYSAAIGLPMMPPYWALGFQLCKYGYGNITELEKVVEENRAYNIPYDVQYGDIDYMDRQLDFTVDPINYPNLSDYVDKMRNEYNMRYVIILDPGISVNETAPYPPYEDGIDKDIFIKTSDGEILLGEVWPTLPGTNDTLQKSKAVVAFPDFFKPITADWWINHTVTFYNDQLKFDGLWIDMNEPENFINGQFNKGGCPTNQYDEPPYLPHIRGKTLDERTICMSSVHHNNQLHYNLHSLYGWSQAEPTMRACREATGKRCYVISRSTYPGAGKYAGHWFGDNTSKWPHLRSSIIQMFEFGLFGISYTGADICGFFEDAEAEMCLRWSQLGAFYPFSRNHAVKDVRRQDPAAWGKDFAESVRDVLLTRYTMLPYLYTLFYHSHTMGSTVVRPLMHEFAADKMTWGIDGQFLWGSGLLITPVLEPGKTAVDGYLPDARWFDYYSGMEAGVRKSIITLAAPKEHINIHLRGGLIIPTQEPNTTTFLSRQNPFGLLVALDDQHKATGDLYWDDGEASDSITMKKYTYSTFMCEGNVLENRIKHDGYSDSSSMMLGTVVVMGLRDDVTRVFLRSVEINTFVQDKVSKKLTIHVDIPLNQEFLLRWEVNNEWSRIDCMPDLLTESNRHDCETRGCLWRSSTTPDVPHCIYPDTKSHGYVVSSKSVNGMNDSYTLNRMESPTMYGNDIKTIQLNVEYQTNKTLHFKIFDPNESRWEIPTEANVLSESDDVSDEASANYIVSVTEDPASIRVTRKDTNEIMFDSSVGVLQFADQYLQISTTLPSLNVYGFGEHNHRRYRHDLNWRRWAMFTRDVAPVDDWNLYGMQTFFMAMMNSDDGKCFGLYLHNTNAMDVLLQPTPALTYRVTGGVLDFYLFVGDSPEEVVQEYHKLIGFPVMPPYWGLGFHLSRWDYKTLDRVKEVVNEMREAKIPFDVQYGDIDYMEDKKSFTYDKDLYNGLPEFVDQLHDWGMRYIIIVDPGIKIEEGYLAYDRGIDSDIFMKNPEGEPLVTEVWPGNTHHPDFTNPNSESWWTTECKEFYDNWNITYDALWIDMNEPANFQPDDPVKLELMNCTGKYNFPAYMPRILGYWVGLHDKTFCMDNLQGMGIHYDVHSLYGHTMSYVTYQTLETVFPDKRSLVLTRSNFAGTGKYAQHWLGDNQSQWPQMGWAIPAMFEFNLFGFPFIGADICGFWFNTTSEMCQRWMQVGAFYPFSRNHNGADMIPQHPTVFGEAVTNSSRDALNTRYSILPYMYTLFYEVSTNGGTLVRALVHEFPSDKNTWNQDRQFLLGPAFLVTPVMEQGVVEVTGYFPNSARWFDFYTGKEQMTGKFLSLSAPLDYINLHIRGGFILPMQKPNVTTTLSRQQPLSLLVALDDQHEAHGSQFWDDGESRDYSNNFLKHTFVCNSTQLSINLSESVGSLPEADGLYYEKVTIYGLDGPPSNIDDVGGSTPSDSWSDDTKTLVITNLNIPLSTQSTIISWSF